ncbi:MAG: hypothetical protein ACREBV_10405, partial [Candidatus Zixiibacteriota bacterium]
MNLVRRTIGFYTFTFVPAAGLIFTGMGQASENTPTYYVYEGKKTDLELDRTRIAIEFFEGSSEIDRRNAALRSNLSPLEIEHTGIGDWFLAGTKDGLKSADDVYQTIMQLVTEDKVKFASPVFHGHYGTWISFSKVILIQFKPEYAAMSQYLIGQLASGLTIIESGFGGMTGAFELRTSSRNGFEVLALANKLAEDPRVAWAEPDAFFSGRHSLIPNDPDFGNCWGIRNTGQFGGIVDMDMDGELAWDSTTGNSSIKVLIIDTGVDPTHPDINQLPGEDFTTDLG